LVRISRKYWILSSLALGILGLDQGSKHWVLGSYRLGETLAVIPGIFNLTYIRNPGAAFGIFAQADAAFRTPFFLMVPLVALLAIAFVFWKLPPTDIKISLALSSVVGGAIGNLIDRMRFGYVVDFLDFHWKGKMHFPAFNVADAAICVGVGLLMFDLFFYERKQDASSLV